MKPGIFENLHCRLRCLRMKEIVKCVGPQDDASLLGIGRWALGVRRFLPSPKPRRKFFACEFGHLPLWRYTNQFLHETARDPRVVHEVNKSR